MAVNIQLNKAVFCCTDCCFWLSADLVNLLKTADLPYILNVYSAFTPLFVCLIKNIWFEQVWKWSSGIWSGLANLYLKNLKRWLSVRFQVDSPVVCLWWLAKFLPSRTEISKSLIIKPTWRLKVCLSSHVAFEFTLYYTMHLVIYNGKSHVKLEVVIIRL